MRCIEFGATVCVSSAADETSNTFDRSDEEEEESMPSEEASATSEGDDEVAASGSSDWKTRKIKTASDRKLLQESFGGLTPIS